MADFGPPNQFSNVAHKLVYDQNRESVLFVKVLRRPHCHQRVINYLTKNLKKTAAQADAIVSTPFCATGFIIKQDEDHTFVLTCCHLLKEFYTNDEVLTLLASMFKFMIVCCHNEIYMEENYPDLYNLDRDPRNYTKAQVVKLDQSRDLLLLQIDLADLHGTLYADHCLYPHPPLQLAKHQSAQLDDVVMISWPSLRRGTVVIGQVVNHRSYSQITADRSMGYNMELVELNIIGEKGTSGSPILNLSGDVVALYHARLNGKGYAVSLAEIYAFIYN
ncbi:uncharacterized protein LOC133913120 [Phragmites australis]|uniref:uncharacterized protein LOC133913120 n=1 Tax=Phragmites australis TaxID=29695 RepID=UPI002D79EFA6|nr:uncharacterized protein LOC133913120 [Phragmites australis]XP_062212159.1 uncharacterized protein LOC133913120 [Phragmites australis]